jgi:hypothetical protein
VVIRPLVWILLFLPGLSGAAGLHLLLTKTRVEYGKALRAELFLVGADSDDQAGRQPIDLEQIDLAPVRERFGIVTRDDPDWVEDRRWPGEEVQRLRMRLYPLTTGKLTIPSLNLGGLQTKAQVIEVRPAAIDGHQITFHRHLSTTEPWQRQQVILWTEVSTPEAFVRLTVDEDWQPPGFDLVPLPLTKHPSPTGQGNILGIGWLLFPLLPGEHHLDPPAIGYRVSGHIERRFYPGITTLQVKALPPYVPPTMPVGRPTLVSRVEPSGPLPTGSLAYWNLSLSSDALPPRRLPPIRGQIRGQGQSSDELTFLAEKVERTTTPDQQGIHGSLRLQYPFKPLRNGRLQLPELQLDWFDPETGRLQRLHHQAPRPWVYHQQGLWLLAAGLLLVVGWLLWRLIGLVTRSWRRRSAHRRLMAAMAQESSPYGLRLRLRQLAKLEGWTDNLSLQQWSLRWRHFYKVDDDFDEVIGRLSDSCYSGQVGPEFRQTRARLIGLLGRRRKRGSMFVGTR